MDIRELAEVKELSSLITPLKKNAWIPVVTDCAPNYTKSRFSGFPWLAKGKKVPKMESSEMTLHFQYDISELPQEFKRFLHIDNGYIQLFMLENDYYADGKDSKALLINTDTQKGGISDPTKNSKTAVFTDEDSARLKQLNAEKQHRTPEAMKLFDKLQKSYKAQRQSILPAKKITAWKEVSDYPHPTGLNPDSTPNFPFDIFDRINEIAETYDLDFEDVSDYLDKKFACYDGDKLGGHPYWTQDVETPEIKGKNMIYIAQLGGNGNSLFKVDGTGHLFYEDSNPKNMKFIWACT